MELCPDHSAHKWAIDEHDRQLTETDKQLGTINETLAALREIERQNQQRIDSMDDRLAALESVPADRWNKAAEYALTVVLGMAIGLMASQIGM